MATAEGLQSHDPQRHEPPLLSDLGRIGVAVGSLLVSPAWASWQPVPPSTAQPKLDTRCGRCELQHYVSAPAKLSRGFGQDGERSRVRRRLGPGAVRSLLSPRRTSTFRIRGKT